MLEFFSGATGLSGRFTEGFLHRRLHRFINCETHSEFELILAWIIAAMRSSGPFPILALMGPQGSAKSTNATFIRGLVDPNIAALRAQPEDRRDLAISANHSWVISLDNVSKLPKWLSDALCRLSTGGGFSARRLYTDSDEIVLRAQRPIIINSIDMVVDRPDLRDRALVASAPRLSDSDRRTEYELY